MEYSKLMVMKTLVKWWVCFANMSNRALLALASIGWNGDTPGCNVEKHVVNCLPNEFGVNTWDEFVARVKVEVSREMIQMIPQHAGHMVLKTGGGGGLEPSTRQLDIPA